MPEVIYTERANKAIQDAVAFAQHRRHEFLTPEHLLFALTEDPTFARVFEDYRSLEILLKALSEYLDSLESVPQNLDYTLQLSEQTREMMATAIHNQQTSSATQIDIPHIVNAMMYLNESWANNILYEILGDELIVFFSELIKNYTDNTDLNNMEAEGPVHMAREEEAIPYGKSDPKPKEKDWKKLVTCMNDHYASRNPLIGREKELQRTMQVLCRKEKNNPLHVGEPGVGKTALVWGLVKLIEEGNVPERLKGSKVYLVDLTTLVAGTQFRGDFEKRIKTVMEGIRVEGTNNIVYIDEIHTLVGTGATGESAMDASNILKPYLEDGSLRFIGSTTYDEFNRHFAKSKGLMRRFQQIDIDEPAIDEAKNIIRQLQPHYEKFHDVIYSDEGIDFAVEASVRHITDRSLPDKAIDLIDEAGAAMEMERIKKEIGVKEIADVLAKICKVDALAQAGEDDFSRLENLTERMTALIYGQEEAVRQVVESVQMARAGLLEENKPLASLLFVGPTGVGKTEVAKVLADELGVPLIRFDMSEYVEKHSVAKLIGAPAGYVGYDDGGQLTDAVRKSPNCVLLLDEIEKAHQDIYNILLQVMDYGRLTDNKGRHADFRNVILIMTSNAGAQHASQATLGFASTATRGGAMMKQVKRTFRPEFLNRLSGAVVFNDMDHEMATLILRKKLGQLERKLEAKDVKLDLSPEAFEWLLKEGFTPEYGAREMDRVIRQQLNPLLMREILFGALRAGGKAKVDLEADTLSLTIAYTIKALSYQPQKPEQPK